MDKLHGNTGNNNASKGGLESFLHIRVSPHDKSMWVKAAQRSGKTLSDWTTQSLNAATDRDR